MKKSKKSKEWIGVDLDGTLAMYDGWQNADHIGPPILLMVERVKFWLSENKPVKIVTARVSVEQNGDFSKAQIIKIIEQWCIKHIGQKLPVTNKKDFNMIELWDDRCVQVIPNTGKRADGLVDEIDIATTELEIDERLGVAD